MEPLVTDRLVLRPWLVEDAAEALGIYGHPDVARWLSPEMDHVPDLAAMRLLLQQWVAEDDRMPPPAGRWAIDRRDDGRLLGGAISLSCCRCPCCRCRRVGRTSRSAGSSIASAGSRLRQ